MKSHENIVTIAHVFGKFGGHSRHLELARSLGARGIKVVWIAPSGAQDEVSNAPGVEYLTAANVPQNVPILSMVLRTALSLFRYRSRVRNAKLIFFSEFDILAFCLVRFFVRPSSVVFMQRSDLVVKTKFLLQRRNTYSLKLRLLTLKFIYKFLSKYVDKIIVQTPFHQRRLEDIGVRSEISIVANNINTSWSSVENRKSLENVDLSGKVRFLLVANLFYEIKGFDILLDSLSLLERGANYSVTIVGSGADEALIKDKIDILGLAEKVELSGSHPNASSIMHNFDCLLVPSPYDDCPNVVLEGIKSEVPIIATDIDAHRFLLGEDFPLVPLSSSAFANAMKTFIETPVRSRVFYKPRDREQCFNFDWAGRVIDEVA